MKEVRLDRVGLADLARRGLTGTVLESAVRLLTRLLEEPDWRIDRRKEVQFVLLSPQDDPATIVLPREVVNDKRDKTGRPTAFVQGQRYVYLHSLKTAHTTTDLEGFSSNGYRPRNHEYPSVVIQPNTPFSNIRSLQDVLRACKDYVWWADPHFSVRALEELHDSLDLAAVAEIRILSGDANVNDRARGLFKRLRDEFAHRGIIAEWRVHNDFGHDRFIISRDACMNVPPVNTVFTGRYSEILPTPNRPPFAMWWSKATPVDELNSAERVASSGPPEHIVRPDTPQ